MADDVGSLRFRRIMVIAPLHLDPTRALDDELLQAAYASQRNMQALSF
jgi:hypothetical protein